MNVSEACNVGIFVYAGKKKKKIVFTFTSLMIKYFQVKILFIYLFICLWTIKASWEMHGKYIRWFRDACQPYEKVISFPPFPPPLRHVWTPALRAKHPKIERGLGVAPGLLGLFLRGGNVLNCKWDRWGPCLRFLPLELVHVLFAIQATPVNVSRAGSTWCRSVGKMQRGRDFGIPISSDTHFQDISIPAFRMHDVLQVHWDIWSFSLLRQSLKRWVCIIIMNDCLPLLFPYVSASNDTSFVVYSPMCH